MIIDLHTHIFNLRYLPVKGILYRWFVPWPLAPKLARVLVAAVDRGPSDLATVIDDSERLDQYLRAKLEPDRQVLERQERRLRRHVVRQEMRCWQYSSRGYYRM